MDSSKYWKSDIEEGLRSVKIGIKNLINYLLKCPNNTRIILSNIHINLVLECIKEQKISYKSYTAANNIKIELIDIGITINCVYNINEIEFIKTNSELEIDF